MGNIDALLRSLEDPAPKPIRQANHGQQLTYGKPTPQQSSYFAPRAPLSNRVNGFRPQLETSNPHINSPSDPADNFPLDDFDRELLAEQPDDSHWQASNGLARLSLPPRSLMTPGKKTATSRIDLSKYSFTTPVRGQASSSSDLGPPSSPSIGVKKQRQTAQASRNHGQATKAQPFHLFPLSNSALPQNPPSPPRIELGHAPPMVQGIRLISANELPDRFRSIFPFPVFNAIQSKCFNPVYKGDDNIVLSAPTGSGKTAVMELAICRLISELKSGQYKVVYQAPTKSLCSERFRDWQAKFQPLDLQCAELTGDADHSQLRNVQNASIIITTPEKWDSITRKWKDHVKLMQLVKLFLIDEVHILKESRGATLEAVVSRMKSVGSNVRFVALSATVPNFEDIATWLGKNATNQHLPAHREKFGEEFRPVKLQKFVYGYQSNSNDFAFDKICETKLPEVIARHSSKKPIMIFCCTRNSAIATAKNLANIWASSNSSCRLWMPPTKQIGVLDWVLKATISSGVAFHHAGLAPGDRHAVERGFLEGQISLICCTSTLAVGVNLPCHLVIVKNTVAWQDNACKEYADLEIMQMLGRAGRPQFDDSAVAVILTRKERVDYWEKMVSGQECLESCLHLNLIDHLNAEIGLGTVDNVGSAKKWLAGTFLFVRLWKNPNHYKLDHDADGIDEGARLEEICNKHIQLLQETNLVSSTAKLKCTEFGDAMARYYVKFETMKIFLSLPPKAKMSEIISVIAQADEFRDVRLKATEKSLYKEINKAVGIKFPIKVDIALTAHKVSLLIQSDLGGVDFPAIEQYSKHKIQFQQDKGIIWQHANRLIRCIIDCQLHLEDSVAVRHALELARSFGARVWDNSPLQMKQIDQVGIVAVRKLAAAGINSIETLEATEAHRIDTLLSKNPPFGAKLLQRLGDFPKLRVSVKMMGKETKPGKPVKVNLKAEVGFLNEKVPWSFQRKQVYVCFLAETSDGHMIDFRRISASKLQMGRDILLSADLVNPNQNIACYVMCDEIAGTLRYAEVIPGLPASLLPLPPRRAIEHDSNLTKPTMNTCRRRSSNMFRTAGQVLEDEFEDNDLDDGDLLAAAHEVEFVPIDDFEDDKGLDSSIRPSKTSKKAIGSALGPKVRNEQEDEDWEPVRLENGKWACNHKCKDKTACKHFCCRDGLDKQPKAPRKIAAPPQSSTAAASSKSKKTRTHSKPNQKLSFQPKSSITWERDGSIETLDLSHAPQKEARSHSSQKESTKSLNRLHSKTSNPTKHGGTSLKTPTYTYKKGDQPHLSFMDDVISKEEPSSDFDTFIDELADLLNDETTVEPIQDKLKAGKPQENFDDFDTESVDAGMIGLADSMDLSQESRKRPFGTTTSSTLRNSSSQLLASNEDDPYAEYGQSPYQLSPFGGLPLERRSGSNSLFKGTSSSPARHGRPKWLNDLSRKRVSGLEDQENSPPYKRQKPDVGSGTTLLPATPNAQPLTQLGVTKQADVEGVPEWAKDIDPDIWAEFKDVADFI